VGVGVFLGGGVGGQDLSFPFEKGPGPRECLDWENAYRLRAGEETGDGRREKGEKKGYALDERGANSKLGLRLRCLRLISS